MMDDFNISILSGNGFNHTNETLTHHHKNNLLGTENTPTAEFSYGSTNKSENTPLKSDYDTFANCVQQSALLDHRLDGSSFSSLCDLKFSNSPSISNVMNINTNYKNMSEMEGIEANHMPSTNENRSNNSNELSENVREPSFTNLVYPAENNTESKEAESCEPTEIRPSPHYLTLKFADNSENYVQNSTPVVPECPAIAKNFDTVHLGDCHHSSTSKAKTNFIKKQQETTRTSPISTANKYHNTCDNHNQEHCGGAPSQVCASRSSTSHSVEEAATSSSCCRSNKHSTEISQEITLTSALQSSNVSSESDSLASSEEFIDLEINDRNGYQDNTSSHSQQSASGAGGSGGPLGSASALLNGVTANPNTTAGYMSLLPPAVGGASTSSHLGTASGNSSGATGSGTGEGIDFKHLFEELCPVCGDKVSGYHYGLLTCESCKGFFKRTVQNKKVYTCVAERSCHIDKTQRKRCPYCRFQKCLEVGMKLEAVRADRMRGGRNKFGPMYKRDRARKLQVMRQRQLALQALRTSIGSADMKVTSLSPGYQQAYSNMSIKQEIQIPQVSSLTQSPDSSPSPIAVALGQVNASSSVIATPINGTGGAGGAGGNNNSNNSSSTTSENINRGGGGSCHDTGTGSLQNTAESKICFDSGTHPSSTADSIIEPLRVSPMIRDFVQSIDDREWQTQLFALLQKQTYNQVEVDLFELMCKVLDQNLFSQVDWARNTVFFKDLKVDDQMKLLQHSWSDMLVLDHLHQRIHNGLPDETQLNNGQVFNLLWLGLLGVPQLADYFNELQSKLQDLKFDMGDYVCMKFLILLNPDVRGIINKKTVLEGHENVQAALLDYTLTCYPSVTDKFRRLLNILPDIHAMAARGEDHLYSKHCAGSAPTQTLLMEMLHAKRKV